MVDIGRSAEASRAEALDFFHRSYGAEGEMHTTSLDATGAFGAPEEVAKTIAAYGGSGATGLILRSPPQTTGPDAPVRRARDAADARPHHGTVNPQAT